MSNLLPKIDEEINCEKLLVITSEGEKLGILNKKDALKKAQTLGLNLILINETKTPDAPSVAKIMDKGKYLYELKIKNKKANQSGSSSKLKEILVKPQINHNDLSTYAKKAKEWAQNGSTIVFKIKSMGRVANLPVLIQKVYNEFMELVGDDLKVVAPFRQLSPVLHSATLIKNR